MNILKGNLPYTMYGYLDVQFSPSLLEVCEGGGSDAFFSIMAVAAWLAVAVNAVCGTSLGIRGTRRRPSIVHSSVLIVPAILVVKEIGITLLYKSGQVHKWCHTQTFVTMCTDGKGVKKVWHGIYFVLLMGKKRMRNMKPFEEGCVWHFVKWLLWGLGRGGGINQY